VRDGAGVVLCATREEAVRVLAPVVLAVTGRAAVVVRAAATGRFVPVACTGAAPDLEGAFLGGAVPWAPLHTTAHTPATAQRSILRIFTIF